MPPPLPHSRLASAPKPFRAMTRTLLGPRWGPKFYLLASLWSFQSAEEIEAANFGIRERTKGNSRPLRGAPVSPSRKEDPRPPTVRRISYCFKTRPSNLSVSLWRKAFFCAWKSGGQDGLRKAFKEVGFLPCGAVNKNQPLNVFFWGGACNCRRLFLNLEWYKKKEVSFYIMYYDCWVDRR